MKIIVIASSLLLLLSPIISLAGEAKTLHVEQSIEINAKPDTVWDKVSNFGDLGAWHPAVKTTEIVDGKNNTKGAVRLLTLQDGGTIKEKLDAYSAKKHSFSYRILEGVLPVSSYVSTVAVAPSKDGKTTVTWTGHFKRKDVSGSPAKGAGDEDAVNTITAVYKGGLDNLKKISETN